MTVMFNDQPIRRHSIRSDTVRHRNVIPVDEIVWLDALGGAPRSDDNVFADNHCTVYLWYNNGVKHG